MMETVDFARILFLALDDPEERGCQCVETRRRGDGGEDAAASDGPGIQR